MQATKTQSKSKWAAFWQRLTRRTPFWQRRIESDDDNGTSTFVFMLFSAVFGALMIALLIQVLIGPVLLSPGLLTNGLADPLGRGYAAICAATGQCNLHYLMAGSVLGLLIVVYIGLLVNSAMHIGETNEDDARTERVIEYLDALDERIVHLRADLVLAGVLKLSPEEQAEAEADAG